MIIRSGSALIALGKMRCGSYLRRHRPQQFDTGKREDRYLEASEKAGDTVRHKGRRVGEMAQEAVTPSGRGSSRWQSSSRR